MYKCQIINCNELGDLISPYGQYCLLHLEDYNASIMLTQLLKLLPYSYSTLKSWNLTPNWNKYIKTVIESLPIICSKIFLNHIHRDIYVKLLNKELKLRLQYLNI